MHWLGTCFSSTRSIRLGSRDKQRTYMRSMLNDLTLCPKDPRFPGPDKYFPQNFLIRFVFSELTSSSALNYLKICNRERAFNPAKMHKSHIFHPGPYIPESDRFYSNVPLQPGPGRYSPQIVACPCKRGTEYLEKSLRGTEHQKWRYSPFYPKIQNTKQCTCDPPNIRNIAGKGFTSVFKSATKRLIETPKSDQKSLNKKDSKADKFPMILDSQYVRIISQPRRQSLSFRMDPKPCEIPEIKFNTTAKVAHRQKLRVNKAVAFMSSCARFEGGGGKATFLANKNTSKISASNISLKHVHVNVFNVRLPTKVNTERLATLPLRYQHTKVDGSGNDKLGNLFQHLPKPKILLKQVSFNLI